jgi:ethanolamine utilization protein EutN
VRINAADIFIIDHRNLKMRIAEVIGAVTLNRPHPTLAQAQLKLVVPFTLAELRDQADPQGDSIVVYDDLSAGLGCRIAVSEGREAAQPFYPDVKPVDAYNAAILDHVTIQD